MVKPATFSLRDTERLLNVMGDARRELCSATLGMPRRSLLKAGAKTVVENIDELAFPLTGHRKYYQAPPHSTSFTRPAGPPPNDPE